MIPESTMHALGIVFSAYDAARRSEAEYTYAKAAYAEGRKVSDAATMELESCGPTHPHLAVYRVKAQEANRVTHDFKVALERAQATRERAHDGLAECLEAFRAVF